MRRLDVIEVQLLGPPRVERDSVPLAFDTRKATALLAYLSLSTGARPRDHLADLLWPEADLAHARGALRRTLSVLRSGLGAETVLATRDHVRLLKGPALRVDVDQFREHHASGDLERAVDVCRGDLLEGFVVRDAPDFEEWLATEQATLRRELTTVLGSLAAEREAAGDVAGATALVRRWLALDELHEPAHQALIRLLATAGDRAAALVQYRECVRTLSRELGVPPLRETTELYEAVNRGTFQAASVVRRSASAAPRDQPAGMESSEDAPRAPAFVGRTDELSALVSAYAAVGTGGGRVAVVEGEAGIGKTRLVDELEARVRGGGAVVLRAHAYEEETDLPYRPLIDLLRDRVQQDPGWLAALDDAVLAETARLVPEVAGAVPAGRRLPEPGPTDEPGAEVRFLAALWETVAAAAAGSAPGVLVLDDAQWVDEATLRWLSFGLRRIGGRSLLVVTVWRVPPEPPAHAATTNAVRESGGVHVVLGRLDELASGELVRSVRPEGTEASVVHRLWETTEGVPLMLVEFLRATDDDARLPAGVRDALLSRLAPISETGRQVLSAAAVLGRSFDIDAVRLVSGRTDEEAVTAVEEVVRRGLVRERATDYDFDHELLRTVVYDGTSLARRRLLHVRAAEVAGLSLAATARHLRLGGRDEAAADLFRRAAVEARQLFAHEEALAHLRTALELGHPDRCELETAMADVQVVLGDYPGALLSLQNAAADASPDALGGIEHRLGRLQVRRGEYALAEAHLVAALSSASPQATPGVVADRALAVLSMGEPERARALADEAAELAGVSGDQPAQCQAHNLLGLIASSAGEVEVALDHLQRSRELAEALGDPDLQVAATNNLALVHRARGDLPVAVELTRAALEQCARLGDRHREAALHNNLADLLHALGHDEESMEHLKRAVEIFAEVGEGDQLQPEIWKLVSW
ncbi:MAG: AAA family ATPase [Marmoricola sp.]